MIFLRKIRDLPIVWLLVVLLAAGLFVFKDYGLTFPVWLDPNDQAYVAFRYPGLPTSYVIDRDNKVRLVWMGAISQEALEKYLTPLLED